MQTSCFSEKFWFFSYASPIIMSSTAFHVNLPLSYTATLQILSTSFSLFPLFWSRLRTWCISSATWAQVAINASFLSMGLFAAPKPVPIILLIHLRFCRMKERLWKAMYSLTMLQAELLLMQEFFLMLTSSVIDKWGSFFLTVIIRQEVVKSFLAFHSCC